MSKHTPGPWFSDDAGRIWRRNPCELYENGGGVAGDKPLAISQEGWNGEGEAGFPFVENARLIAAAPELLEALESAQMALMGYTHQNEVTRAALEKAGAAIAKARGAQ